MISLDTDEEGLLARCSLHLSVSYRLNMEILTAKFGDLLLTAKKYRDIAEKCVRKGIFR